MKQKHKSWIVLVGALALTTTIAMPIGAMPEQPPVEVRDRVDDLVTCIVKTTGTLVGYEDLLDPDEKISNLHLVNQQDPDRAVGIFEYLGYIDGLYIYRILVGYADGADWCRGPVDDLISDFTTKD